MMRPTLKQIFDFVLDRIEVEYLGYTTNGESNRQYEVVRKNTRKRYLKCVGIFVAYKYYDYSGPELEQYLKISKSGVHTSISKVKKSNSKRDLADELYDSLNILYGAKKKITLDVYKAKLLPIFANENNFNTRSPEDLTKLEKWLINRLYEVENK